MNASRASVLEGLRFAFGTLTVLPVELTRWDRAAARGGMVWAPVVGLSTGLCAAALGGVLLITTGPLVAAVATVAVPAALTRALHLDGLADVADGLGSGRDAAGAREVMKRSDIGPFGVLVLVLVLLAQTAMFDQLYARSWADGAFAGVLAAVTARTALTVTARRGVTAARPDGLGAIVAGTVPGKSVSAMVAAATLAAGVASWSLTGGQGSSVVQATAAVVVGLLAGESLLRHCRRRLGGASGDVFGAVAEVAATSSLLVLAMG